MGSVKKKIDKVMNKVADKIIPKEIAPILPIAAAFVPGMLPATGLLSSTAARYLIPQLMTGLGSAKRTGKINPLAQAMTGLASYAAGPGGQELSGKQQAFLDSPEAQPFLEGTDAVVPTLEGPQYMPSELSSADALSIFKDPEAAKAFKAFEYQPANIMEQTGNFLRPMTQRIGGALNDPFASWGNAMTAAGVATSPALINEAVLSADRAKAEQAAQLAANQQAMTDYQGAIHNLTGLYGQMGTDPTLVRHFNPWEWYSAKDGGRVGMDNGGFLDWIMNNWGLNENLDESYLPELSLEEQAMQDLKDRYSGILGPLYKMYDKHTDTEFFDPSEKKAKGGRIKYAGGDMVGDLGAMHPMNPAPSAVAPNMPNNMQVDGRNGTFIPMGAKEKHDDVPAMLAKNEFVMTSDAVKGMGNGDVNLGAQRMYDLMNNLEANV